jgi:HK97 family phage prohead protease
MPLEFKSVPFEVKEVVAVENGGWEVAGYASTFNDSEPDYYGDTIAPGAFSASIAKRWPKFLFEHTIPIGKTLEIREDARGLYGRWSIVDTTQGTDAYKLAKAGVLDSLSIGFFAEQWEQRADGGRHLTVIDLPEVSAVANPANMNAVITDVKTAQPAPEPKPEPLPLPSDDFLLDLAPLAARLAALGVDIELPTLENTR